METEQTQQLTSASPIHEGGIGSFGSHPLSQSGFSVGAAAPPMAPPPFDLSGDTTGTVERQKNLGGGGFDDVSLQQIDFSIQEDGNQMEALPLLLEGWNPGLDFGWIGGIYEQASTATIHDLFSEEDYPQVDLNAVSLVDDGTLFANFQGAMMAEVRKLPRIDFFVNQVEWLFHPNVGLNDISSGGIPGLGNILHFSATPDYAPAEDFLDSFYSLQERGDGLQNQSTSSNWEVDLKNSARWIINTINYLDTAFDNVATSAFEYHQNSLYPDGMLSEDVEFVLIQNPINSALSSAVREITVGIKNAIQQIRREINAYKSNGDLYYDDRVAFRDHLYSQESSLSWDTIDLIFNFLLINGVDPFGEDFNLIVDRENKDIRGTNDMDIIVGGDGDNNIRSRGGNDLIIAGGGDDIIYAGGGQDTVWAGEGDDAIYGGYGHDILHGEGGNDRLIGGNGNDSLYGGEGADWMDGKGGTDILNGNEGNDVAIGGSGIDNFHGEAGEDLLHVEAGESHDGASGEVVVDSDGHGAASGGGFSVVDLSQPSFEVATSAEATAIANVGATGIMVPVTLGPAFGQASIPIFSNGNGYQTPAGANIFVKALNHPLTSIFGSFLDFGVRVTVVNSAIQIEAETRLAGTEIALSPGNLDTALQQLGIDLGGLDFGLGGSNLDGIVLTNTYENGFLNFDLSDLPLEIGGYVKGAARIGFINGDILIEGELSINLGNGISGFLDLAYDGTQVYGSAFVEVNHGDISGSIYVYYNTNGVTGLAGIGTGYINTNKLNAELDLFFGPAEWVEGHVQSQISTLGLDQVSGVGGAEETHQPPSLDGIPQNTSNDFSWAGIASGTVPIGKSFEANAVGILDSEGDYLLKLSLSQSGDIPLTDAHSGSWGFEENYPIADFGIPLVADISANLFAGLGFGYDFSEITLQNASLSGTYAKAGNKYGVNNSVDLGGSISMDDKVDLIGKLGFGLSEHLLSQSGQIRLDAELMAEIGGNITAEADIRAEFDENGFHPHFNIVMDISEALDVSLSGHFFAENKVKHWFSHDSTQTVDIDLGGFQFHLGDMDLEMGYNSDAHESKFSFGPPEGKDRIFQISSIEDMIENMQTLSTSVTTSAVWAETEEGGATEDPSTLTAGELDNKITGFKNSIDDEIDDLVETGDKSNFQMPDYGIDKEKTYKVMKGLLELYQLYDRYQEDELSEEILNGLIGQIRKKHDVFTSLNLVEGKHSNGVATYGVNEESNYLFWEWTASPKRKAPALNLSRPSRIRRQPFDLAIKEKDYIVDPHYTPYQGGIAGTGGEHSYATMGPDGLLSRDSDANSKLPDHITQARLDYPNSYLVAGHLLNAQFGGSGTDADNITILSSKGNSNHKKFDQPVKDAMLNLRKAYELLWKDFVDLEEINLGIYVSVKVDTGTPWPWEDQVFSGLICEAELKNDNDIDNSDNHEHHDAYRSKVADVQADLTKANNSSKIDNTKSPLDA